MDRFENHQIHPIEMSVAAPPRPPKPPTRAGGLELPPPGQTSKEPPPPKGKGRWVLAGLAVAGTGAVAVPYYAQNPDRLNPQYLLQDAATFASSALNRAIEITQGWNWFKGEAQAAPETFDPKATKGVIGPENSVQMTPEEYAQVAPPEIEEDNVNLPIFIKFPDGTNPTIRYELGKGSTGGKRYINPRLNPNNPQEMINDGSVMVNDVVNISNVPAGSILLSPVDGMIYHGRRPGMSPDGSYPHGAAFFIKSSDEQGNEMDLTISTVRIKPLIDTPSSQDHPGGKVPRIPIAAGQPIGIIMTGSSHESFPGQIRVLAASSVKDGGIAKGGVANINFSTTTDGKAITLK